VAFRKENVMFRFAELLIIAAMLFFIANLLRYILYMVTQNESKKGGLFALSDSWIASDKQKRRNKQ
jgi:hypothetical protein